MNKLFKIVEKDGKFIVMVSTKNPIWKFWAKQTYEIAVQKNGSLCVYGRLRFAKAYITLQGKI